MSTTPNMGMTLPDVSITPGPTYASQVNTAMAVVDSHDHTPGFGVKVPSAGLNINADLAFGGFNATGLQAAAFTVQVADPAGNSRIYFKGSDLYVTDAAGNHIQMTVGGNVNVGSVGAITGMGGTSATVSFSNATKVFTFNQAANQTALLKIGDIALTDSSLTSGAAATLKVPAGLASGYTVTLPAALPGSTSPLSMSSTGTLSAGDITDESTLTQSSGILSVKNAGVTRAKLAAVGEQTSSSSGVFTTSSGSFVDVTNLTVTITTTGRPVVLMLISASTGINQASINLPAVQTFYSWNVDGSAVQDFTNQLAYNGPPNILSTVISGLSAASHTIKLQAKSNGSSVIFFTNTKLVAYELA